MENSHAIFTSMMLKGISEQNQHLSQEVEHLKQIREDIETSINCFKQILQEKPSLLEEVTEQQLQKTEIKGAAECNQQGH